MRTSINLLLAGLVCSVLLLQSVEVQATVLAYESFDTYSGDINNGSGGTGWTDNWATASSNTTAQSSNILSYSAGPVSVLGGAKSVLHTGDNANPQASRFFPTQTSVVYFSLLMQLPASAADEFVGFHFTDSTTGDLNNNPSAEVGLYGGGGSPGFVRAAMYNPGGGRGAVSTSYVNGDIAFVVGRISDEGPNGAAAGEYDRLELFVNPASLTQPAATVTADYASAMTALDTFAVRTANFAGTESFVFDEVRIGTTYEDVVPFVEFTPGDFDYSGDIDETDFLILAGNLGGHLDGAVTFSDGDINFDGKVDLDDFGEFKSLYPAIVAGAGFAIAPEPGAALLAVVALVGGLLATSRARVSGSGRQ